MTRAGVATPTTTATITQLMQTTNASVASARNRKVPINLRANSGDSGSSHNNNNNNTNNNSISNQPSAGQNKYLTWCKIVSEHNNNDDNYTYKSNNYNESYKSKSNIATATATTRRKEQIGNVDGNAGGNGSVRVAHTGNANKSRIRKSENSYYTVNKFVLAANERRSVRRRRVNKSLVNSVNKHKNRRKSNNRRRANGHSSIVKGEREKGKAFANITRPQFDRERQFSVNYFNKSVRAGAGVSIESQRIQNSSQNLNTNKEEAIFSGEFSSRAQISTHDKQQSLTVNNSATIATTTTTTASTRLDYIVITDYNRPRKRTFWQKYGRILLIAIGISLSVACISVLIVAINCYRVTALKRRATVALTLPIPLLPEDQTLLHTEPDNPVPMLSVQTAGYAGMERLGVPTRTTLNSPPDDRGQYSCRMRVETLPARDILVRSETVIRSNNTSGGCTSACMTTANSSGNKSQQQQQQLLNQEHHNQHSHHHQQQQHHHQYQQQHYQHHHNQQQHYQRMSTQQQEQQQQQQQSACSSASSTRNGNMPARSTTTSISNSNSSSNFMRGGIEAATLKYGSMGSGSGGAGGGYGSSISGSSCGSNSSCNSHSIDHHLHYQQAKQPKQQRTPRCPHHVPLPDSEWGQDRSMQLRASYQQSELTRSYIKPPPNKTIKDVPEQSSYNFNALSALSGSNITLYATPATSTAAQPHPPKSKPNVITKLFSRKSSPKSPTALASSSSSTSACSSLPTSASITSMPASTSSSTSSIASATGGAALAAAALSSASSSSATPSALASTPLASMPISTASSLKTTACSYGASSLQASTPPSITAGLATSTQLLTTIGVSSTATPASIERIPTPPLSVTVPIGGYHHLHHHLQHHHHQQQQQQQRLHQQQQQILLDSIVAESATPTTLLQSLKSSSCNLATAGAAERNSSRSSLVAMDCYPLTAAASGGMTPRSRTPTTPANNNNCNCNSKDCNTCTPNATT
ncbi:PREDICTED: uncharacterized protein LOC108978142 [Bactrocera latifrons]|nr:PREDICTED: uncharacterized protein LOC108978142 [Bactrocera latifrons]